MIDDIDTQRFGLPGRRRQPGMLLSAFSLAEVLVSLLLVSGLVVVALNTVGDATLARHTMSDRGAGHLLAHGCDDHCGPQIVAPDQLQRMVSWEIMVQACV